MPRTTANNLMPPSSVNRIGGRRAHQRGGLRFPNMARKKKKDVALGPASANTPTAATSTAKTKKNDDDSNILRGAEIVRQQISKQLEERRGDQQQQQRQSPGSLNTVDHDGEQGLCNNSQQQQQPPASSSGRQACSSWSDDEFSDPWEQNDHRRRHNCHSQSNDGGNLDYAGADHSSGTPDTEDSPTTVMAPPSVKLVSRSSTKKKRMKSPKKAMLYDSTAYSIDSDYSADGEESSTVFPHLQLKFGEMSFATFPSQGDASWANLSMDPSIVTSSESSSNNRKKKKKNTPPRQQRQPDEEDGENEADVTVYDFVGEDYGTLVDEREAISRRRDRDVDDDYDQIHSQSTLMRLSSGTAAAPAPPLGSIQGELDSQDGPSYLPERIFRTKRKEPRKHQNVFRRSDNSNNKDKNKSTEAIKQNNSFGLYVPCSLPAIRVHDSERVVTPPNISSSMVTAGNPPLSIEYTLLLEDPAYRHAQNAGMLWQSLVGQQVRFPSRWWNGSRTPPLGLTGGGDSPWQYLGRQAVRSNRNLNKLVRNRSSPGRLLLHIIVQDLVSKNSIQDIAIGCFHPNARGVRTTASADRSNESNREVWIAVRKRFDAISSVDMLLSRGQLWDEHAAWKSPVGRWRRVTNENVRAVFGEAPPLETLFLSETDLYERLTTTMKKRLRLTPVMALLEEFVLA